MRVWNTNMTEVKKTNVLKLLILLFSHFTASSQSVCRRPRYHDWYPQPRNITIRLSLMENTCRNVNQCWNGVLETLQEHWTDQSYAFPQLCPVEVQLGDALFAFTDPILEQYGINLINMTKEQFDGCFTEKVHNQHLFASSMKGSIKVASKWLSPGVHYFAATHKGSSHLCQLGLRFNVLVKVHHCRSSPHFLLCSGKGACRAKIAQFSYNCQCRKPYSEPYCDALDMCSENPCLNGATCINTCSSQPSQASYQCLCPSVFTGINCSEILGQTNCMRQCRSGVCSQVSPNSFRCDCFSGYTGTFCTEKKDPCSSQPCGNRGKCEERGEEYICMCPEGFTSSNCEVKLEHNCTTLGCQQEQAYGIVRHGWMEGLCQHKACLIYPNCCLNGATCISTHQQTTPLYRCTCSLNYTDKNCSIEVTDCTSLNKPGQNNGTFYIKNGDILCRCPPGLTGQFCEINIDDCASSPCGTVSICKDGFDTYHCFCAPGFIGNNCEIEVNECLSQPCKNGASCLDQLDSFSCVCPEGVTGAFCETDINECLSSPCLHGGTCVDVANGFICICSLGFTGPACEVDIDECSSSPCKNEATCRDQPGVHCEFRPCEANNPCENSAECVEETDLDRFPLGFHCHCLRGFTGPHCEINKDECIPNPCVHGFCYDVVDAFYCLCNPGYAGVTCEQDVDDCLGNACENNSTCVDFHLSYQCVCGLGWEGKFCEIKTSECASNPCENNGTCTTLLDSYT